MARRSLGEGSISQRKDGRWHGRLQLAGKRVSVYGRTRGEVADRLRDLSGQGRASGHLPNAGKQTLCEFLSDWLSKSEVRLRPGTVASYSTLIRCHIVPALGNVRLSRLQPLHLAHLYAEMARNNNSARRIEMVHRVLHKALADAYHWLILNINVADHVECPKPNEKELTLWTPQHIKVFLDAAINGKAGQYGPLFAFLLASGCREGEIFGLNWGDVDWEQSVIRIERQITWVTNRPVELRPKTKQGIRTLTIPTVGMEMLRAQRSLIAAWQLKLGTIWSGGDHVFTSNVGTTPSPSNLRRAFRSLCISLGLPILTLHTFRHLNISLLAMAKVPVKVAQQRAGHSSPAVTMKIYTHVLGDADREAAQALDLALG